MDPYPPTTTDRHEAELAARYLAENNVTPDAIYSTLVDDLGVLPHTALSIVAIAA